VRGLQRAIDICQLPERFEFMSRAPAHQAVQGTPPAVNRTR